MSREASPKRQAKRLDDFFDLGCTLPNQWTLYYLGIVLECDTPILEAVCRSAFGHCMLAENQTRPFVVFMLEWYPAGVCQVVCTYQTAECDKSLVSYESNGWRVDISLRDNRYPFLEVYFPIGNRLNLIDKQPLVYGKAEATITRVLRNRFPQFKSKHLLL